MSGDDVIRERWLANLKAAGIDAPDEDLERAYPAVQERIGDLYDLFKWVDSHEDMPDYLRDTMGSERDRV